MMNIRNVLIGSIVSAVVVGIVVSCGGGGYGGGTAMYSVGGNITGAAGTVTLKLNGGGDMPITGDHPFTFAGTIASGSTYNVQVIASNQRCTVANGAGTMGGVNITNVAVTCGAQAAQMVIRSARLTGAAQNPPVATNASGVGGIIVDPSDLMNIKITGGITFSGLVPLAGMYHIHQSSAADAIIIGLVLASDGVTATVPPNTTLTQAQYDALLAGELYFNVHTMANPGGEIRGQINMQGGVHANVATLTGGQEVPPVATAATGTGTLLVDKATGTILVSYVTHNVTNANMAHIHVSPTGPGNNGDIRVGFNQALGASIATAPAAAQMTSQDLANLLVGYLYFNVHSVANGGGEIRGDITVIP